MHPDQPAIPPRPPLPSPETDRRQTGVLRRPGAWLLAYGVALAAIAFWPTPVDAGARPLLRAIHALVPLLTYSRIEFAANVLLFVPVGLLVTLVLRDRQWLVLPLAILATVTIETVQAVALHARTPSTLDIIANTAGACAGMAVAALVESVRTGVRRSASGDPAERTA